jgi:hypothetical protein
MEEMETIKKKVKLYHNGDVPIHVVTNSDSWVNGYILNVYDDYFEVFDRHDGKVPIFYADVGLIEFFRGDYSTLKRVGDKE